VSARIAFIKDRAVFAYGLEDMRDTSGVTKIIGSEDE
jgi:hypothetical protein